MVKVDARAAELEQDPYVAAIMAAGGQLLFPRRPFLPSVAFHVEVVARLSDLPVQYCPVVGFVPVNERGWWIEAPERDDDENFSDIHDIALARVQKAVLVALGEEFPVLESALSNWRECRDRVTWGTLLSSWVIVMGRSEKALRELLEFELTEEDERREEYDD